jgi:two-component system LytT family response regulator
MTTSSNHPLKTLRTIIVDDEEPARRILREYLSTMADITLIGECSNGFEAVKAIGEERPDLVFLDVQMPKLNGFEVLELLEHPPAVVFATAYDQYALKAFDVHAVDYLLKPFRKERLEEALTRVRERLALKVPLPARELATMAKPPGATLERILIKNGTRVHVIPLDHVDYIEAQDDYIAIHAEGKEHLKQQRLADLEDQLVNTRFLRVHRSFILNLDRLTRIELYAKDSRVAILKDGTKIPISRKGYDILKDFL